MRGMANRGIAIRTSPHLKRVLTVDQIMRGVILALLPIAAWSVWQFGLSVLLLLLTTTGVAALTEWALARAAGQGNTLQNGSVIITGLLLGLTLPPGFPLWMAAVAACIGVALGKWLFGGLGYNVMNPALVGRAFVQAAFPKAIATWSPPFAPGRFTEPIPSTLTPPFMQPIPIADWIKGLELDAWTGATPLAVQRFQHLETPVWDLFAGTVAGSAGETSALLILICGLWLAWQRMLDWRIPASVMAGAVFIALPFWLIDPGLYPSPAFVLCSGGLMLGAWFMASDMVASPVTPAGVVIYGLFIGVLTVLIRLFGGLVEGVMYAILIANALSPWVSDWTQPRVYGSKGRGRADGQPSD